MEFEITIKNYRCFPDSKPARVTLSEGFQALVGVNNSGKSSLLRFFYEFRALFQMIGRDHASLAATLRGEARGVNFGPSVSDPNEIFNNTNDRDIYIGMKVHRGANGQLPSIQFPGEMSITVDRNTKTWVADSPVPNIKVVAQHVSTLEGYARFGPQANHDFRLLQQACRVLAEALYVGPFRNAINAGANQDYYDIKVGQAFITEWREHKTGASISRNEAIIRLTDGIRRIFEFDRLEIDAATDNANLKVFVNNKSFKLTELGAGLTQFVLVLANAAVRRPSFILIDEPETNLHPSLQMDFLTTLASYAQEGLVFGTHSVGLARAMAARIYSLRRISEGQTEVRDFEATPRLSEFLGELGFSGYQELGYDKVLLVEGPTDVTTFQQFLRIYGKDHKIVILPLGGSSLINAAAGPQLTELKRVTQNIAVAIDSERQVAGAPLEPDRQAFVSECQGQDISCHVLERRATENYFTDAAVKAAKGQNFKALGEFETLRSAAPRWNKSENWRIAREMSKQDLDVNDLGQFLAAL